MESLNVMMIKLYKEELQTDIRIAALQRRALLQPESLSFQEEYTVSCNANRFYAHGGFEQTVAWHEKMLKKYKEFSRKEKNGRHNK